MLTILEGATFCVCDESGDIDEEIAGFFALDTRFLSRLRLTIDGLPPRLLDGRQVEYFSALIFMRNDISPGLGADELLIRRERFVGGHLHERLVLLNVSQRDLAFRLGIELAADFADILSVKQHDIALGHPDRAPAFPEPVRPAYREPIGSRSCSRLRRVTCGPRLRPAGRLLLDERRARSCLT